MSKLISPRPRSRVRAKRHFAVVASQFNTDYVQGLVDHATAELRALSPDSTTTLLRVPGAFEIPVVVRELAMQQRSEAIIAIGARAGVAIVEKIVVLVIVAFMEERTT